MATWIEQWRPLAGDGPRVAVKDLIDVAGSVTTAGCRAVAERATVAGQDAPSIAAVRRAGGRLVGKVNLHELAFGTSGINPWFGTPANPADPGRVPGGSSSGSAVSVATGEADVALGSDTGGSVRIPAACCGVVGLKTTYGRLPLEGVWPLAPTFDTVGVLGSRVDAVVTGMALMEDGFNPAGETPESVGRLLLDRAEGAVEVDPVIDQAVDAALAAAGLRVESIPFGGWRAAWRAQQQLLVAEAHQVLHSLVESHPDGVGDDVRERLQAAAHLRPGDLAAATVIGRQFTANLGALLGRHHVVALPTLAGRPPIPEHFRPGFNLLTAPVNLAGYPAVALPVPTQGRPPASIQLVGPPGSEELLCAVAARIEAAVWS
jgi:amidase